MKSHMLEHMKQILVQLDDRTAAELERVVPASTRRRSEFIRAAIARALLEAAEVRTAAAYAKEPDERDASIDPGAWVDRKEAIVRPRKRAPGPRAGRRAGGRS